MLLIVAISALREEVSSPPRVPSQLFRICIVIGWDVCDEVLCQYIKIGGALKLRSEKATGDKKQSLPKLFMRAVHDEWYPTLEALRASPSEVAQRSELLESWQAFGEELGLVESDEKVIFEREKKQICAWRACEYHTRKAPSATRQCAGCGQAVRGYLLPSEGVTQLLAEVLQQDVPTEVSTPCPVFFFGSQPPPGTGRKGNTRMLAKD